MKVLFDQNVPHGLREMLPGHTVATADEQGWSELTNGELLKAPLPNRNHNERLRDLWHGVSI
jgi:hypothetical protein